MSTTLSSLIEQGRQFNFGNNSYRTSYGTYSKPSDEFLAWVAGVEHFLIQHYDNSSGPFILFNSLEKKYFSGYEEDEFNRQLSILRGVLLSCQNIPPSKQKSKNEGLILTLIINPLFWSVIVILSGGAFTLGIYFGNAKFDKDLIDLTQNKKDLQDTIKNKNIIIQALRHNSDSALNIIAHMPYSEMHLDTIEFKKVQTTIENAGAVLTLNK